MAPAAAVIAVDVGGTKTHLVRASVDDAAVREDSVVPSAAWRGPLGSPRADADGLAGVIAAQFGPDALALPLAVGAHGCDTTDQCAAMESELRRFCTGPVLVVNDSELMAPALGVPGGVGLVVGTGSIATGRTAEGVLRTAGGWGHLLGDEGSAPALVREATRAALAHLDAGGTPEPLVARLLEAFDARDGVELSVAVTADSSPEGWGRHAPAVFDAADAGSALAEAVIRDAGDRLAGLVDQLLARGVQAEAVVAGGSVIARQARLQDAVRAGLASRHPRLVLRILDRPPVDGALALARALARQTSTHPHG